MCGNGTDMQAEMESDKGGSDVEWGMGIKAKDSTLQQIVSSQNILERM